MILLFLGPGETGDVLIYGKFVELSINVTFYTAKAIFHLVSPWK